MMMMMMISITICHPVKFFPVAVKSRGLWADDADRLTNKIGVYGNKVPGQTKK